MTALALVIVSDAASVSDKPNLSANSVPKAKVKKLEFALLIGKPYDFVSKITIVWSKKKEKKSSSLFLQRKSKSH